MIYTLEAHPIDDRPMRYSTDARGNPIEQPIRYEERVVMASLTVEEAGVRMPILVDEIDNPVYCTYGGMPNSAYLIGRDGRVLLHQSWNDPAEMDSAIQALLVP